MNKRDKKLLDAYERGFALQEEYLGTDKPVNRIEPLVSVRTATYQHAPYIRQCLDSILMQETDFPWEFIIGEDGSTDGTREICIEYAERHPDRIRLFLRDRSLSQYQEGDRTIRFNGKWTRRSARAKYLALCEGDDYWTDPKKLQKQVNCFESHPKCSLVFHGATIISAVNPEYPRIKRNDTISRFFSMEELIMGGGGLVCTASIMHRSDCLHSLPSSLFNVVFGDYTLVLIAAARGTVFYLDENMAVYRTQVPGSMTSLRDELPFDKLVARSLRVPPMLYAFDDFTDHQYRQTVEKKISDYLRNVLLRHSHESLRSRRDAYRKMKEFLLPEDRVVCRRSLSLMPQLIRKTASKLKSGTKRVLRKTARVLSTGPRALGSKPEATGRGHSSHQLFTELGRHVSAGYYDLTPFDHSENRLLACQLTLPLVSPPSPTNAAIVCYDLLAKNDDCIQLGETTAWNWQQGCRLRWFPHEHSQAAMYNVTRDDHYASVIQDVQTKEILREISYPLYDLDPSGRWGVTLNFSRLHRMRPGYGYADLPDETIGNLCPQDDGVWLVDLGADNATLLFSLADLAKIASHDSMVGAEHYINHLSFSPDGQSFLFFHLWLTPENRRQARLFTGSRDGSRLTLLNNTGHVSHYTWLSASQFLVTTYVAPRQLRYVLYHHTEGFQEIVGLDHLKQDGHPSFLNGGRWLLTDTYPDPERLQHLLLYDRERNDARVLGSFFTPPEFTGELRCDLHPRRSPTGRYVAVDAIQESRRAVVVLDMLDVNQNAIQ